MLVWANMLHQHFSEKGEFDVVIGNPPYNKGMDLDFVYIGYQLSKQYSVFITPAKWQTAEADQTVSSKRINYGQFRKILVPHMSHVCFYPDAMDAFSIGIREGISYYLLVKNEQKVCTIKNICTGQSLFNSIEIRELNYNKTLNNTGNHIVEHFNDFEKFKFRPLKNNFEYSLYADGTLSVGGPGHGKGTSLFNKQGSSLVFGKMYIVKKGEQCESDSSTLRIIFNTNEIEEIKSFYSYINAKIVKFLVMMNVSSRSGIFTDDYFRFVPAPPARYDEQGNKLPDFDHIYTDQELYQAFNLPQKYIDVIEAIIKERK